MPPLWIDFNPTAPRVKTQPKPRVPKAKVVRVKESRMTAAEARPRPGMPRAFAEEKATARRALAEVNRPAPAVHWIIPGLDTNDGRAHPVPSGGGAASTIDIDAAMAEARANAQAAFDHHQATSDHIRTTDVPKSMEARARSEQAIVDNFRAQELARENAAERQSARNAVIGARAQAAQAREEEQRARAEAALSARGTAEQRAEARREEVAADLRARERIKARETPSRILRDLNGHGEVVRSGAPAAGGVRRRGVAFVKPTPATPAPPPRRATRSTAPALQPPATPAREPPRARLGATPMRALSLANTSPPSSEGGRSPPNEATDARVPRERRLASAINWRTEPHLRIPETGADRLHAELSHHLADAEVELAGMTRSSRHKTQLAEKVDYLKTQVARMAGGGGVHPVASDLQKLGLTAKEAERARELGYVIEGRSLKRHGNFQSTANLRRALDEQDAGAAGSGAGAAGAGGDSTAHNARVHALEDIGELSAYDAKSAAFGGFSVKKSATGAILFYNRDGTRISKANVQKYINSIEEAA